MILRAFLFVSLFLASFSPFSVKAEIPCIPCLTFCGDNQCKDAADAIKEDHKKGEDDILKDDDEAFGTSNGSSGSGGTKQMDKYEDWLLEFTKQNIIRAMMMMTEQLSAVAMQQVLAVGMFFDAKEQLETQRLFQELQTTAHRDYQPSRDFCWFGTNVRSLAHSEQKGRFSGRALAERQLSRHLGNVNMAGALTGDEDRETRWKQFTEHYCDVHDNNWTGTDTGLELACGTGGDRINKDIDYARLIEGSRSLEVNFDDGDASGPDEQDVMALGNNLYGNDVLVRMNSRYLENKESQHLYMALRSVAAKRAVAENSYNAIVGMKSEGTTDGASKTREFLGALMTELGIPAGDVYTIIGKNPSYYAQLELLAKKMYQNPDFFSNLYDTPVNVERKKVALKAIEMMLDRAIYESQLRREMATSVLLSAKLHKQYKAVNSKLTTGG